MNDLITIRVYRAYLLRCWCDEDQWRYSLEKVGNGRRQGFASLTELGAYLRAMEGWDSVDHKEDSHDH